MKGFVGGLARSRRNFSDRLWKDIMAVGGRGSIWAKLDSVSVATIMECGRVERRNGQSQWREGAEPFHSSEDRHKFNTNARRRTRPGPSPAARRIPEPLTLEYPFIGRPRERPTLTRE